MTNKESKKNLSIVSSSRLAAQKLTDTCARLKVPVLEFFGRQMDGCDSYDDVFDFLSSLPWAEDHGYDYVGRYIYNCLTDLDLIHVVFSLQVPYDDHIHSLACETTESALIIEHTKHTMENTEVSYVFGED